MGAWAGFFGKMPATGDFVARDLPQGLKSELDRWLLLHVVPAGSDWPASGLRGLVDIAGRRILFLALPSCDRLGREYPLVAVTAGADVERPAADRWCDAILPALTAAQAGETDSAGLQHALASAPPPHRGAAGAEGVWAQGSDTMPATDANVRALLSSA